MSLGGFRQVKASKHALRTYHPINEFADKTKPSSSPKSLIKLSIGDPTLDGNIRAPTVLTEGMVNAVRGGAENGYTTAVGDDESREVVAQYWQNLLAPERRATIEKENVVICSGGSHGIVLSITALCNEGDNLLIPNPGFPHYKTVCVSYGVEPRAYRCDPHKNWEVDLLDVRRLVNSKTKGIMLNNPSNPCGSNFSRKHIEDIVRLCEELQLPIISDEIYAEVVFTGEVFTSVADIDTCVPRVILGGTAKKLAVPGWRFGWAILVDRDSVARSWVDGMDRLTQLHAGVSSVAQKAHANAILQVPQSHLDSMIAVLEEGASAYDSLTEFGFEYIKPRAAMFVMVKINFSQFKDIKSDVEFFEKLLEEENVQVLPGGIFGLDGYFRATITRPVGVIREAVDRIGQFCKRHAN
ncbi:tyrosine transaminase [Trypanosoma grayi]|uniref:tyrosine transaminase n=1 Tax=Trypanosoma grayi TaxID=71804 RepID=UPI0004F40CFC|nr:tyrosine transaminase [Trypanosoma grayi]KEG07642.1 tyrosine transaminase [Trypanosoma grayi]